RVNAVLAEESESCLGITGSELLIGADLHGGRDAGPVRQVAGVVLHVDDESVDLGAIGEGDEVAEATAPERPGVHVYGTHLRGRAMQRWGGPAHRIEDRRDRHRGE